MLSAPETPAPAPATAPDRPLPAARRGVIALLAGLLVLAAFLAYANVIASPFLYDDTPTIVDNPTIRHWWALREVFTPPGGGVTVSGRPVLNLSFALNYAFSGVNVHGYHLGNILIHALAGLTLFGLARRTLDLPAARARFGAMAVRLAFAIAALWTLHPLLTEGVSYIAQRAESLMALFYLLTLYAFARAAQAERPARWLALSVIACALGMGTKENMVSAPVLVLLYDRALVAGSFGGALRARGRFYAALGATWLGLAFCVLTTGGDRGGTAGFGVGVSWGAYALTQFPAITRYVSLSLWPQPLVFDYGTFWIAQPWSVLPQAVLVIALVAGMLAALRKWPAAGFLAAWFFAVLAPTSLVPGTIQMIVEHRMYLPLAPVLALVGVGVVTLAGPRAWPALLAAAVAGAWLTHQRNHDYRSALAIWSDTVAKRPESAIAHTGLGSALAAEERTTEAIAEFREATRLRPDFYVALSDYGSVLNQSGRSTEALEPLEKVTRLKPDYAEGQLNLGIALDQLGHTDEALARYRIALRLQPGIAATHSAIGYALDRRGDSAGGIAELKVALAIDPGFADAHYNLAVALLHAGRRADADQELAIASRLKPKDANARLNWANALLTSGRGPEALTEFAQLIPLAPAHPEVRYNYGNALAAAGRFDEAAAQFAEAARLRPDYVAAYDNLGNALTMLGRESDAIPQYEAALKLRPDNARAHNNLGLAYARLGRMPEATAHFAEAVRLAPDYAEARENLARARAEIGR